MEYSSNDMKELNGRQGERMRRWCLKKDRLKELETSVDVIIQFRWPGLNARGQ